MGDSVWRMYENKTTIQPIPECYRKTTVLMANWLKDLLEEQWHPDNSRKTRQTQHITHWHWNKDPWIKMGWILRLVNEINAE